MSLKAVLARRFAGLSFELGGSLSAVRPKGLSLGSHFDPIVIHVWDGELIVTMPGSSFKAVYHKPANQPQLVAKQSPSGTHEFRARALVGGLSAGAMDGVDRVMWPQMSAQGH